jgi:hypothetical protein
LDSGSVQLADFNAGATRVLVDASGNVGIGPNTSPGAKLDVQGDTIVRGLFSLASSSVTVASGGTLAPTTSYLKVNSFTSVALSGTTAIADGTAIGNVLVLQGPASATSVTIPNAANTKLGAASRVLGTGDTLTLIWDGSDWVETAFSNN